MKVEISTAKHGTDPRAYLDNAEWQTVELETFSGGTTEVERCIGNIESLETFARSCPHDVVVGISEFDGVEFDLTVYNGYLE